MKNNCEAWHLHNQFFWNYMTKYFSIIQLNIKFNNKKFQLKYIEGWK